MSNIYSAMAAVMADVDHVAKRDINTHQKFVFRGIDAVLNAVGPVLRKHKVIVVPEIVSESFETVQTSTGKPATACRVQVAYTFYGPEGDSIRSSVLGEAWDSGDKAGPKAMSVAFRTALLQALALPTDEPDPDSQTYERAPAPAATAPPLAAAKARAWAAMKRLHTDWPDDERKQATETELAALGSSIPDASTEVWNALADELEARAA